MKTMSILLPLLACFCFVFTASADELPEGPLEPAAEQGRWHISAGARFTPGVKTRSVIPSGAVLEITGRPHSIDGARRGPSTSTEHRTSTSAKSSSESVPIEADSRFEFENGFIDMTDDAGIPGQTSNWHFNSADALNEASGGIVGSSESSTTTSRETTTSRNVGKEVFVTSGRSSSSGDVWPDIASSHESDLWGADLDVGYDLWRGERFSLGVGFGASFYRGDDAIRTAGRCYEAATGRFVTTTETTVETTTTTTETMTFANPNLAYDGALDDIKNDDDSIGAGTPDGRTNPYGGNNPVLKISDGGVTTTTTTDTRTDTTVTTTRRFESSGSSSRRTVDVAAEGDVETQELRAVLQPAWLAAEWLELRGSLGAVATRVSVDADTTVFVNGARFATVSGDDDDWGFAGLCGLDAVIRPRNWLELFLGADLRFGNRKMDYRAGLVQGTVKLDSYSVRIGLGIRF